MTTSMILILVAFGLVVAVGVLRMVKKDPRLEEAARRAEEVKSKAFQEELAALEASMSPELKDKYDRGLNPTAYQESTFYTLTKCVHCGKLEKYLESNSIPFTKVLLDDFQGPTRQNLLAKMRTFNERGSFPTLVSPDGKVSVGFRQMDVYNKFMSFSTDPEKLMQYEDSLKK